MAIVAKKRTAGTAKNADGDNEGMLVSKIIAFLSMNGWEVWRQDNSGKLDNAQAATNIAKYFTALMMSRENEARRRAKLNDFSPVEEKKQQWQKDTFTMISRCYKSVANSRKGVADIIGFNKNDGRFIGIEIKINKDVLSEEQKDWGNKLKNANGVFMLARSYDQFLESYYRRFKV